MPLPELAIEDIECCATEKSFSRGEAYFNDDAVVSVTLRQQTLSAEVEGNEIDPYRVTGTFDQSGVTDTRCSCPYSFGGWCKHIVATLLVCVHQPESVEERPSLNQLLAQLDLSQSKQLIQSLVTEEPTLIDSVDFYISTMTPDEAADDVEKASSSQKNRAPRKPSVNPEPYKRRVREIIREAARSWEYGEEVDYLAEDLSSLIDEALAFSEQGDGHSTLMLLKGITEGCAQSWAVVHEFLGMDPDDFDIGLDEAWTETILSTELTDEEVRYWQQEVEALQDLLGGLEMATEALKQGWDYPPLQQVLDGEITEKGAWEGEAPDWADTFSQIRLKILKRQERYEDYLHLAEAEGQTQEYLTMLGQLGRVEEAMTAAREEIHTLHEAKALAESLRNQDKLPEALEIAMKGLRLDNARIPFLYEFSQWTRDLAEALEETDAAIEASIVGFGRNPLLKDYRAIELLAGDRWSEIKEQLLQQILEMNSWQGAEAQISILLYENLVDQAIEKVSGFSHGYYGYRESLVLSVMDAAIASHDTSRSEWVVKDAIAKANEIINAGKANGYETAVEWLKRAKAAYSNLDQVQYWQQYRRQLAETHGRKRKLMGLLKQNRV